MKRLIVMVLVAILIFGTVVHAAAADQQNYKDLKTTNWAYESVRAMTDKGVIKGYPDGNYRPQNIVTYGEFIKMMVIASTGTELAIGEKPYHWAYNYYQKGLNLNFYSKTDIDISVLNEPIPRKYMAFIVSKALNEKTTAEDYSKFEKQAYDVTNQENYKDQIINVYAAGIINGYPDGSFKPNETLTRAESSSVLWRFMDSTKRQRYIVTYYEDVDSYLKQIVKGGSSLAEFYGINSAKELQKEKPTTYYSILDYINHVENKPISDIDISGISSITFSCENYKIVNMKDIGFNAIKTTVDKYNCEQIEVSPGDNNTQAILIKDNKVICDLTSGRSDDKNPIVYAPDPAKYYNGAYQNTKLMDYDYIGFWSAGTTLFLVEKTW